MTWFPRLLGIGTAAIGAAVVVRPDALASACGLADSDGKVRPGVAMLCRAVGARDLTSGLSMTFAPSPDPLRMAVVGRATADISDAVVLDLLRGDSQTRSMVATLAAGRGLLCALSGLTVRSDGTEEEAVELAGGKQAPKQRRANGECRAERPSPIRRWVSGIVDEELRDAGLIK
jgi:hypothetical protein